MIKNAATTKAASNTSPGLLLLFYITIGTLPTPALESGISWVFSGLDSPEECFEGLIQPAKDILKTVGIYPEEIAVLSLDSEHSSLIFV
jgi:hypothetical protein